MPTPADASTPRGPRALVFRVWAGLTCGVCGGALAVAWYALQSALRAELWWGRFNVAAWPIYGMSVYEMGLSRATLCGVSLLVLLYAVAGALFGLLVALVPRLPALAAALLYSALVHFALKYSVEPLFGYWAVIWFPVSATLPAHLLLAAMLARWPQVYARLAVDLPGEPYGDGRS
jgi:hypothetical protein